MPALARRNLSSTYLVWLRLDWEEKGTSISHLLLRPSLPWREVAGVNGTVGAGVAKKP
jgi:hypothetical protein